MRAFTVALMIWGFSGFAFCQTKPQTAVSPFKIKKEELKSTLVKLGFATKDLGNSLYQVTIGAEPDQLNIIVSISASQSKIWLTYSVGILSDDQKHDPDFLYGLLEKNGEIQPAHFYVRKNRLGIGFPIDNRSATATILKKEIENFAETVRKVLEKLTTIS